MLRGSEQDTVRFERGNVGWKVVDYAAVVSCPSGGSTKGLNVGSCILALGTIASPSFQIVNLQLFSTDLPIGGCASGSFASSPLRGLLPSPPLLPGTPGPRHTRDCSCFLPSS